jgi:hypothetical protein
MPLSKFKLLTIMARKKTIKDTATSTALATEEILDTAIAADLGNEGDAPEEVAVEETPVDAPEEVAVEETPVDAPEEVAVEEAPPEVSIPAAVEVPTKLGAVFTIKDGAVEFVLRRLRSRLSRTDLPDVDQVGVILAAIAAGKTAVIYRSGIVVGALSPGRPTFDLVNDLQRHGYLSEV